MICIQPDIDRSWATPVELVLGGVDAVPIGVKVHVLRDCDLGQKEEKDGEEV
jgi:hypothetical protein